MYAYGMRCPNHVTPICEARAAADPMNSGLLHTHMEGMKPSHSFYVYICIYAHVYNNYLYTPMCLCIGTLEGSAFHSIFIHVDASNGGG